MAFAIKVNGDNVDVDGDTPLLWCCAMCSAMTDAKFGCGMALLDGIGASEITTIEGDR